MTPWALSRYTPPTGEKHGFCNPKKVSLPLCPSGAPLRDYLCMDSTQQKETRLLVTKREAASALSVSIRTVENFIRRKELGARKIGRRTLIPLASLESFARRDHASPVTADGAR